MEGKIPVVDFSTLSLKAVKGEEDGSTSEEMKKLVFEVMHAFESLGFVYLANTGISEDLTKDAFSLSKEFFLLPSNIKDKFKAVPENDYQGYFAMEDEVFSQEQGGSGDLKESFDFTVNTMEAPMWPVEEVVNFKKTMVRLFEECALLSRRILKILGLGLDLRDPDFFTRCHNIITNKQQFASCMRTLYYPPIDGTVVAKAGQSRLGEHTDYGTITLVIQDDVGGLQVRNSDGQWIEATPIQGTVLVNAADILQRWTSDRLRSTPHRIALKQSTDGIQRCVTARQSLAFFVHGDPETEVRCLDGSNKYDPIRYGEYVRKRILDTSFY